MLILRHKTYNSKLTTKNHFTMNKFLTLTLTGLLAAGIAYAELDWSDVDNVASGATVTLSSNISDSNAKAIVDDNNSTGWQAKGDAAGDDWALLDLGETKTFSDIEIKWEASHPSAYDVYVTDSKPTVVEGDGENTIAEAWLTANTATASRTLEGEANIDDQISGKFNGRYILIYVTADNNNARAYGSRIYEVRAGDFSALEGKITKLALDDVEVIKGQTATVTVSAKTAVGDAELSEVSGLTLTADDEAVVITTKGAGEYEVSCDAYGEYTLTATGTAAGKTVSGTAKLTINPDPTTNIMKPAVMTAQADAKNADGQDCAALAIDGNTGTGWKAGRDGYGETESAGEHLHWLLIDLKNTYNIDLITVQWEGANSNSYDIYCAETVDQLRTIVLDDAGSDEPATQADALTPAYTFYTEPVVAGRTDKFFGEEVKDTQYVLLVSHNNASGYGLNLFEISIYGVTSKEPEAASMALSFDTDCPLANEPIAINAVVMDQYGAEWTNQEGITLEVVDGDAVITDGSLIAASKGDVTVKASQGEISATETITIIADKNDTVAKAKITAKTDALKADGTDSARAAVDGVDNVTGWQAGRGGYGVEDGVDYEAKGDAEHWLLLKLWRAFDLDLITVSWEGANSNKYDIYCAKTLGQIKALMPGYEADGDNSETSTYAEGDDAADKTISPTYTYDAAPVQAARIDRFYGNEAKGVNYILLASHSNATAYGLNLYEINLYGTYSEASKASEVTLETSVGQAMMVGESGVTLTAAAIDQYGDEMPATVAIEGSAVDYDDETGLLSATAEGRVKITVTVGEGEDAKSMSMPFGAFASSTRAAIGKVGTATATLGDNTADASIVISETAAPAGQNDYYQPATPGTQYYVTVALDKAYAADVIEVVWETAHAASFTIAAAETEADLDEPLYTVENRELRGYDYVTDRVLLDEGAKVQYIRVAVTADAMQYASAIRRIRLYNETAKQEIDEATGVIDINVAADGKSGQIYNLRGIRVDRENLPAGVYIIDGVKKIVK